MLASRVQLRLQRSAADRSLARQLGRVRRYLQRTRLNSDSKPVLFFNASTRIHRLSLNGAFNMVANWGVRLDGVPTVELVCRQGMLQCMLGTDPDDPEAQPPCQACVRFSEALGIVGERRWIDYVDTAVPELGGRRLPELISWEYKGLALGQLCLPTLRWSLRRHNLTDDATTQMIFRKYLHSAASLKRQFETALDELQPRTVVVFNGITYPEALLRELARQRGIPVVTHEVGLRPNTAFFSHGQATAYPIEVPAEFQLTSDMQRRLDDYLADRFQGRFTMAGVRFWPEVSPLPDWLNSKIEAHQQTVVVFTNVIFDTSQIHANSLYQDMFEWLEDLKQLASAHLNTLFIVRAHPDEDRPGKRSRESVSDWMGSAGMLRATNVEFLAPDDPVSSYELVRRAKLVLVYNSSVGLEASVIGAPVLCAGRARYTQLPTVYLPESKAEYQRMLSDFLSANGVKPPEEFSRNARRFFYYQLFHASLDFSEFLDPYPELPGFVTLSRFEPEQLDRSADLEVVRQGIIQGKAFVH